MLVSNSTGPQSSLIHSDAAPNFVNSALINIAFLIIVQYNVTPIAAMVVLNRISYLIGFFPFLFLPLPLNSYLYILDFFVSICAILITLEKNV